MNDLKQHLAVVEADVRKTYAPTAQEVVDRANAPTGAIVPAVEVNEVSRYHEIDRQIEELEKKRKEIGDKLKKTLPPGEHRVGEYIVKRGESMRVTIDWKGFIAHVQGEREENLERKFKHDPDYSEWRKESFINTVKVERV